MHFYPFNSQYLGTLCGVLFLPVLNPIKVSPLHFVLKFPWFLCFLTQLLCRETNINNLHLVKYVIYTAIACRMKYNTRAARTDLIASLLNVVLYSYNLSPYILICICTFFFNMSIYRARIVCGTHWEGGRDPQKLYRCLILWELIS